MKEYDLTRFLEAQSDNYEDALREITAGRKQTCWMWYVFPQIAGLGRSPMAERYALSGLEEAKAYLAHPVLGPRLRAMCQAALAAESDNACMVFGIPDDLKLRSSMTLFEQAAPEDPIFGRVLEKYFQGSRDGLTLQRLAASAKDPEAAGSSEKT